VLFQGERTELNVLVIKESTVEIEGRLNEEPQAGTRRRPLIKNYDAKQSSWVSANRPL
jgi:hypothetical protein